MATYGMFGSFVGLVFCDYGGPPRRRAGAYLVMIVLGLTVITIGAALSAVPVLAVVGMFVIMFCATWATAFGGYFSLHVAPVALAYSLSVLEPLRDLALPDRWLGWLIGGMVALIAALVLWPIERRTGLRAATVALARDLGELIGELTGDATGDDGSPAERLDRIAAAVAGLETRLDTPLRPFGPRNRDVYLVHMIQHLEHAVEVTGRLLARRRRGADDAELCAEVARALTRSADVLAGESPAAAAFGGLGALDAATLDENGRIAARLRAATDADGDPIGEIDASIPLLTLAHLSLWIEYDAMRIAGGPTDSLPDLPSAPELAAGERSETRATAADRARRVAIAELDPEGVILANSIRAGAALAVAVAITELLDLEFGFWVALATLCILRSGISSTLACARQAVVGTLAGFVVSALLVVTIGDSEVALWIVFPVIVFVAGYSGGAIGFAVGQAAFTVAVVALFGILDLPGFRTDVLRVQNVTVGALVAVALSVVIWPRGARRAIARTVAAMYRAAADAPPAFVTGAADARAAAEEQLSASRRRAEDAFAAALAEHTEPIEIGAWVEVFQVTRICRALTLGLLPTVDDARGVDRAAIDAVRGKASAVADDLRTIADRLDDAEPMPPAPELPLLSIDAIKRCLAGAGDHPTDGAATSNAIAIVWWDEMLTDLAADLNAARAALDEIAAANAPRAWYRGVERRTPAAAGATSGQT